MKIELAVSCHQFQHRFCWMMSSLLRQVGDVPEFLVNAAYVRGTGSPTTSAVLDYFEGKGMSVKHTAYDDDSEFRYRGLVRNRQIAESDADWLWFGDCDMAVHPAFLSKAKTVLEEHADDARMLFTGRYSTGKPSGTTDALVESFDYPCTVTDPYEKALTLNLTRRKNLGAGFCQIISVKALREVHGGLYVDPADNNDMNWETDISKCKSDRQFRNRVGKCMIKLPWFIHLQHVRDSELGKHTEIQR